jgi:hypothetical protein
MQFGDVQLEDFTTFKAGVTLPHVEIEKRLIEIGGNGVKGNDFKKECLLQAGWKYGKLTSYGAHPEVAVEAFTTLKDVLENMDDHCDRDAVMEQLSQARSA